MGMQRICIKINIVLSIKLTYPVASSALCHLPAFQADSNDALLTESLRIGLKSW